MVNQVFVIYNRLSRRYGDVVAFPSAEFAVKRLRSQLKEDEGLLDELELCQVGVIDIDSGVMTSMDPVRISLAPVSDLPVSESIESQGN